MRCPRLYCPDLRAGLQFLPQEESHHAHVALRLATGNAVVLFDGQGNEGTGTIVEAGKKKTSVDVQTIKKRPFELFHRITLAVAMGRVHRQGYLIEKCTELGVAAIQPIIAERSVSKPDGGSIDKWKRRAIEACKQAGRAWLPKIEAPISFDDSLQHVKSFDSTCLVHPSMDTQTGAECSTPIKAPGQPFSSLLASLSVPSSILVWVGPEGGWSEQERQDAERAGVSLASLGPTVLRTETAAIAVCAAAAMDHEMRESPG